MKYIDSKFIGGILLIIGTSIGGGMLALPVANAATGFIYSTGLLILCWLLMTLGALFVLEVNLWLPTGSNIVSMAEKTLGRPGKIIAWLSYLFLLYTLLSAYISGGTDILESLLDSIHAMLPSALTTFLYVFFLGAIVYTGIRSVDYVNRFLMFMKLGVYLFLVVYISPKITLPHLAGGSARYATSTIMILITSFGFASIVPSLRSYFKDDITKLRKVILIGSLIPLTCYIAWDAVIMGVVPRSQLINLMTSEHTTSGLTLALASAEHNYWLTDAFGLFTAICMLTAFLGVSIGLFDFLADGLKLQKKGWQGKVIFLTAYLPPLSIVLFYPGAYLYALNYAGIFCVILLLFLPAVMAYRGRYQLKLSAIEANAVPGGKWTISFTLLAALCLLIIAILQMG